MPARAARVALILAFAVLPAAGVAAEAAGATAADLERMTPAQLRALQAKLARERAASREQNAALSRRIQALERRNAAHAERKADLEARLAEVRERLASLQALQATAPGSEQAERR